MCNNGSPIACAGKIKCVGITHFASAGQRSRITLDLAY